MTEAVSPPRLVDTPDQAGDGDHQTHRQVSRDTGDQSANRTALYTRARPARAPLARRARRALDARGSLLTGRPVGTLVAPLAGRPGLTLRALLALVPGRSDWTLRALLVSVAVVVEDGTDPATPPDQIGPRVTGWRARCDRATPPVPAGKDVIRSSRLAATPGSAQQIRAQSAEKAQQVRAQAAEKAQHLREQAAEKAQPGEKAQQLAQEAQQLVQALGRRLPRR